MRNILLSFIVTLVVVSTSGATWIETFDTGVGRFQYYEEEGDTVFTWNSLTQSLDATFIRRKPFDKRYALITAVEDYRLGYYGFSTVIKITGKVPGSLSDPAGGLFGFMNSAGSELYGSAFVHPVISRPSVGIRAFYLRTGGFTSGTSRLSTETIPFEFGTTYFIDAMVNGPEDIFQVDFYEGENRNGSYLGTLTVGIDPQEVIGFDALGFSGMWDTQKTVVEANFDNFAFLPEPYMAGHIVAWGLNSSGQCEVPEGNDFVDVEAGGFHGLAIKSDGSLVAWGPNNYGECNVPSGNDFVNIGGGLSHSLALRSYGSLVAWGDNSHGECEVPEGNDFVDIAAGEYHSLALKADGSLAAWGSNTDGQSNVPSGNFIDITAGWKYSAGLKSDGSIVAWGRDAYAGRNPPAGNDYVAIAGGTHHALALKSDGSLAAWGWNNYGQCNVPLGNDFVAVAGGYDYSFALKSDGSLVSWGSNSSGQSNVPAGNYFVDISAGHHNGLALVVKPTLLLLDPNGGEVLTGGTACPIKWSSAGLISEVLIEYSVDNGSSWKAVTPPNVGNIGLYNWFVPKVRSNQCLMRVSDANDPNISDTSDEVFIIRTPMAGYLIAWGYNEQGQCNVPAGKDFVVIEGGNLHSLALKSDGSLKAWGANDYGQSNAPAGSDFVVISAGYNHNLSIKSDASLAAWGANEYDQCEVPDGNNFVAISGGDLHSLALKSDGSLAAWGDNRYGQCNVPTDSGFVGIAAGKWHCLALKSDGSLTAWGLNNYGQCDISDGNDFVDMVASGGHGLALKSDGSLAAWGDNRYGQCNVPTGNDFAAIGVGVYHSLALKSNGSLVAWGKNAYGECTVPDGNNFVDIAGGGYHNLALLGPTIGGYIDWTDLAVFCDRWLESGCSDANYWCRGADINRNTVVDSTDYSWLAKYWASIAPEPNAAGYPEPHDTATGVSITADLSWTAGTDTAAHGVYFGISPTLDANEFQGYQTETIFNPGAMAADTTYYWQVDEFGLGGETSGEIWSFTTSPVPGKAYNPSPSDSATNININHNLSWTANFYTTSHDVYFGTNPTPGAGEFEGNQTATTLGVGTLDYETTYYWRIDGVGPGGTTTGIIWSFTTEATPVPGQASNPVPADMATDVNITTCLIWTAGVNTTSHDVYFGTGSPGDFHGNQTTTTFCPPSSLEYNTTYYWRIDEKNPYNTTPSVVWSFTTMDDPNLAGWWKFDETSGVIAYDSSGKENHGQLVDGIGNGLVWAPGEGALNFDGSNNLSRVVVSTVGMSTTAGTITIWANLAEPQNRGDGRNGSGYFFGCDNGVKDRILLYMDNSNTQLDVRVGDHSESNIITLGTLVWYHIALTWNGGSYVVHLNGAEIAAGTYGGLTSLPSTADIGNNGGSYKQSFHGLMGEVQVYDKSLSATEIQQLYQDAAN